MELITPNETFVSKLPVKDKIAYIKLTWKQNENDLFHIQVLDNESSWSGRFSNEFAQKFRERENIDENEAQYSANVKKCLKGEDNNYTYDFTIDTNDDDTATFSWKRKFRGVHVLHGKVPVHRDPDTEHKDTLVDILLEQNKDLKNHIKEINTKSVKLTTELEKCKNELEKYVNIKTSLETTLYGKFVQLLNSKKRRIQLLEDNLMNFEEPNNVTLGGELD